MFTMTSAWIRLVDQLPLYQRGSPAVRLSDQSAAPEILQSFI